ncbi:MAG: hypothetical protein ABIG61_07045 [Planctomycetota bacterium]
MNQCFKYILRCAIEPGFHEEERLANLVKFCKAAIIDDVAFLINCEELNQGHITKEEAERWLEAIVKAKKILAAEGITTSLNPWETFLHAEKGRLLKPGQKFNLMVDYLGNKANSVVCPLCLEWRRYFAEICACYAGIEPAMIWIEDDFRLHNHSPLEWGGCFCDLHMKEFSKVIGKKVSRSKFFEGIVKPGEPGLYRKAWLHVNRQTMNELAKLIGKAIHKISPKTKVGLMSSIPTVHCAEGRDWNKLLDNMSGGTGKIIRPHLPAYLECSPGRYLWDFAGVSPYTQAFVPAETILYPELDNHTASNSRFSKSHKFARFQIILALTMGIKGITLNIFQMNGNGPILSENQQKMFSRSKEFFNRVAGLGLNLHNQKGVKVLVSSRASEHIRTRRGISMEELYPSEIFWSQLLSCYGISNVVRESRQPKGGIVAVSGQYFRGISKRKVREIFEHSRVILDGQAAETLCELGLGKLVGIKNAAWIEEGSGIVSYEQINDCRSYCGICDARVSAREMVGDALQIEYCEPVEVRTLLKDPAGRTVGNGVTVYDKRVVVLPYGHFPPFPVSHLNPVRQELLKTILLEISGAEDDLSFTIGLPYLPVYRYEFSDRVILIVINSAIDKAQTVRIYLGNQMFNSGIVIDSQTGKEKAFKPIPKNGIYEIGSLGSLEAKLVVLKKRK